jgi:superfamily II RNA helicase
MRQLIDLLRQIATTTHNDALRSTAEDASRCINRGVVAAAQGGSGG